MHIAILLGRLLKVGVLEIILKMHMMQLCYLIIRIMWYVVWIPASHIIHSRDFPFFTLAVLVATLLAGMKFCECGGDGGFVHVD